MAPDSSGATGRRHRWARVSGAVGRPAPARPVVGWAGIRRRPTLGLRYRRLPTPGADPPTFGRRQPGPHGRAVAQQVALLLFDEERRDELVLVHGNHLVMCGAAIRPRGCELRLPGAAAGMGRVPSSRGSQVAAGLVAIAVTTGTPAGAPHRTASGGEDRRRASRGTRGRLGAVRPPGATAALEGAGRQHRVRALLG